MTTTAQAFTEFLSKISPTEVQRTEVRDKRTKTEGYLRDCFPQSGDLPLKRVILIGSADRGTLVRPIEDIDVMAEFVNKDDIFEIYRRKSGDLLQRIRRALNAKTSIANIGARGQAVRLFYTSGAHVDIAPVFHWSSGGFALPSGDGGWITTDPEAQAKWLTDKKASVGSELTNRIKLLKRWNQVHSARLQSYHLEVVVASYFSTVSSNHREGLELFFKDAASRLDVSDPAGHSGTLSGYLTYSGRAAIKTRFSEAYQRATKAMNAENSGDHQEAKRLWAIELGSEFPAS